jgi:hypothetical protein
VLVTVFPWWDGPVTRQEAALQFAKASRLSFERWLWLHQAPPDRSPTSWAGKRFIGDAALVTVELLHSGASQYGWSRPEPATFAVRDNMYLPVMPDLKKAISWPINCPGD